MTRNEPDDFLAIRQRLERHKQISSDVGFIANVEHTDTGIFDQGSYIGGRAGPIERQIKSRDRQQRRKKEEKSHVGYRLRLPMYKVDVDDDMFAERATDSVPVPVLMKILLEK